MGKKTTDSGHGVGGDWRKKPSNNRPVPFLFSFLLSLPSSLSSGRVWVVGWWVDEEKEEDRDIRLFREGKKCSL